MVYTARRSPRLSVSSSLSAVTVLCLCNWNSECLRVNSEVSLERANTPSASSKLCHSLYLR